MLKIIGKKIITILRWNFLLSKPMVNVYEFTHVGKEHSVSVEECLRSKGQLFKTHWRHCVVSLSKTFYPLLKTGSTQ